MRRAMGRPMGLPTEIPMEILMGRVRKFVPFQSVPCHEENSFPSNGFCVLEKIRSRPFHTVQKSSPLPEHNPFCKYPQKMFRSVACTFLLLFQMSAGVGTGRRKELIAGSAITCGHADFNTRQFDGKILGVKSTYRSGWWRRVHGINSAINLSIGERERERERESIFACLLPYRLSTKPCGHPAATQLGGDVAT